MVHLAQKMCFNMNVFSGSWLRRSAVFIVGVFVLSFFLSLELDARSGSGRSSFGGSRSGGSSFGSSRGSSGSRGGSSFGGYRRSPSSGQSYRQSSPSGGYSSAPSFGGSRGSRIARGSQIGSAQEYTRSYGIPRRQETTPYTGNDGISRNYVFNHYGGYGDGIMTGYALGRMSWWWHTPFHPAFYYSAPPYVVRGDGSVEYYPPTISYGMIFFVVLMGSAVVFVGYVIIRNRRSRRGGSSGDMSQSSFG